MVIDARLEVQARAALFEALGGNSVDVTLSQDDVVGATDLDFVAIIGVEQDLVAELYRSDIGADCLDSRPRKPLPYLRRRRNQDATVGSAFAFANFDIDQDAVVQHLDRKLVVGVQTVALARRALGGSNLGRCSALR